MTKVLQMYYKYLFMCLFMLSGVLVQAQELPVNASLVVNAPYSTYLSDYSSSISNRLQATLIFRDFNESSWDVRCRLTLESNGLKIQTNSTFIPSSPITILPGIPFTIQGTDWEEYFDLNNVTVTGITKQQLAKNGKLTEGFYTFSIEILDYNTGKLLSKKASTMLWLQLSDEPVIISPVCGEVVPKMLPQNLLFQWQFMNTASLSAIPTQFKLFVYEITDPQVEPLYALDNGKALLVYESVEQSMTSLLYNIGMPDLELGKSYVFRVRAIDSDGKDLFKNNGYSQNCWFSYGFQSDGEIILVNPDEGKNFTKDEQKIFSWSSPSKLSAGQSYSSEIKIVKLENDLPVEQQFEQNPVWHSEKTVITTSDKGWELELSKELEKHTSYAWQVKSFTQGQEIAKSEIRTFGGPSLVEYFMAGNHKVDVKSIENTDLENLKGIGLVNLGGKSKTEVNFEGLHLIYVAGRFVLDEGEILHAISDTVPLIPNIRENLGATFYASSLKLDRNELQIKGKTSWNFPHPILSEERAILTTQEGWVNYDKYKVFGTINLDASNDFELLDPLGFRMEFYEGSEIQILDDVYTLKLDGALHLPKGVASLDGERVSFEFIQQEQLFYFEQGDIQLTEGIALVENTKLNLTAQSVIIDFSEKTSPLNFKGNKEWKGAYFSDFTINYPQDLDASSQLTFSEDHSSSFQLSASNDFKAWVTPSGITTYFHDKFEDGSDGTFNTFLADFTSFEVDVEDGAITDSKFRGNIAIPVIEQYTDFNFTLPISSGGFEAGFLDQSLEHSTFVFSPYGGENRVDLTIQKAVFTDNERLDLVIDVEIPYINAKMSGVSDFRIYGDYYVGFGKKNGAIDLAEQVEGTYDGFTVYIDKIGASLSGSEYTFSYSATMPLGDEVAGENGAPRLNIFSTSSLRDDVEVAASDDVPEADMIKPEQASSDPQTMSVDSILVVVKSEIVDVEGYLIITKNHPQWGTSLQGGVNGQLKMPAQVKLGTNMILGTKDKMKYWYMDAWFVDESGSGIGPVFNMFSIPAFEGKIYRHMSPSETTIEGNRPNFVINPDVEFGTALYVQLIDPHGGKKFMADVGIELEVMKDHFIVKMEGDISLLNSNTRSAGTLAAIKKEAVKKAVSEAASKALDVIDEIKLDFALDGGKKIGIFASKTKGEFSYADGDQGLLITGDMEDTPRAGVRWYSGSKQIEVGGSVAGGGNVIYEDQELNIGLSYYPNDGAAMNFGIDNTQLDMEFNPTTESGSFNLDVDDNAISLAMHKQEGTGEIEVQVGEDKRFFASADKAGKVHFEVGYEDVFVKLKADKEEQSGEFVLEVGSTAISTAVNGTEGNGSLSFSEKGFSFEVEVEKTGVGSLIVDIEEDKVALEVNKPEGKGSIALDIDGNTIEASADKAGIVALAFDIDHVAVGLSANKTEGSGVFYFNDGRTSVNISANKSENIGRVNLGYNGDSITVETSTEQKKLQLTMDQVSVTITNDGTLGKVRIDSVGKEGTEEGFSNGETLNYVFGEHTISIGGDNNITLTSSGERSIGLGSDNVTFTYTDKKVVLGTDKSLTYRDGGGREADLTTTSLRMLVDDNELKIENNEGSPAIYVRKGDKTFAYADGEVVMTDAENSLTLGGEHYFVLDYDKKVITAGDKLLKYEEGEKVLAFGGDNVAELRDGEKAITFSNDKELILEDGTRSLLIAADKRLVYQEGERTISIGGENLIAYAEGDAEYRIFKGDEPKTFGVGITKEGYDFALVGGKNKDATLSVSNETYGELSLSADTKSNISATYTRGEDSFTVKTGKQGLSFKTSKENPDGLSEAETKNLADATEVKTTGPQYIGDKMSVSAGGAVKGSVQMYFNSKEMHFIANASIQSVVPPCVTAAMAVEATPQTYKIDIGTEDERITIYPSCSGFGGGGWFNLRPESINLGVFAGFKAGGSVDIGVAEISARIEAELGVRAKAQLKPKFAILEAGVWVYLYAGIKVDPDIGSSFTIAEAELSGTLTVYFEASTRVKGELEGHITVLGISAAFDMGFEETI